MVSGHFFGRIHRVHRLDRPPRVVGGAGEQRRVGGGRHHRADADAGRILQRQFHPHPLRDGADRELAADIRGRQRLRHVGDHRGDVDDDAVALGAEPRQRRAHAVDTAEDVGFEHPPVELHRHVLDATEGRHPGVVHPDVDPAEGLRRAGRQRLDCFGRGDVGGNRQRLAPEPATLGRGLLQRLFAASSQNDGVAALGKRASRGEADPAGSAGYHDHPLRHPLAPLPVPGEDRTANLRLRFPGLRAAAAGAGDASEVGAPQARAQ